MKRLPLFLTAGLLCLCSGCTRNKNYVEIPEDVADSFPIQAEPAGENPQFASSDGPYAVIHTTAGTVTVLLYPEQAPKAVENFVTLAQDGYYDGSSFYYTKRNELAQGGRPADPAEEKSIWGEPFADEFDDGLHHFSGAVGMAGNGMNQNLSQFYLLVQDTKPEDERVIPANLYMNELIRMRSEELNEKSLKQKMSDEDVQKFEADLNAEIQAIGVDGVPGAYEERYEPVIGQYQKYGGAWNLDYSHTVFGQIVEGMNVAKAITQVKVEASTRKPKKDIVIERIEILENLG